MDILSEYVVLIWLLPLLAHIILPLTFFAVHLMLRIFTMMRGGVANLRLQGKAVQP